LKTEEEKYPLILDRIREISEKRKGAVPTDEDLQQVIEGLGGYGGKSTGRT
jgi:hypothetical protein